jgi:8-oxo-dGTP pyrophosphatase MutT (NUDIX family)
MKIIYKGSKLYSALGLIAYKLIHPLLNLIFKVHKSERSRVVICNNVSQEIILVKNWLGSGKYQLPGGGIKLNEGPAQGAAREIEEELGLILSHSNFKIIKKAEGHSYTKVFLLCEISSPLFSADTLQIAHHEITEVVSIKLEHINQIEKKIDYDTFDLLKTLEI